MNIHVGAKRTVWSAGSQIIRFMNLFSLKRKWRVLFLYNVRKRIVFNEVRFIRLPQFSFNLRLVVMFSTKMFEFYLQMRMTNLLFKRCHVKFFRVVNIVYVFNKWLWIVYNRHYVNRTRLYNFMYRVMTVEQNFCNIFIRHDQELCII